MTLNLMPSPTKHNSNTETDKTVRTQTQRRSVSMTYLRCHAAIVLLLFLLLHVGCSHGNTNTTWKQSSVLESKRPNLVTLFLRPHNAARAALGLPRLVWDQRVAMYAQWYANQRRWDCALKHSNGPYGENIFWGSGYGWTPGQAVSAWFSETKWYNYDSNSCEDGEECGHYTQIMWHSSRKLGCAKVTCFGGRGVFIICNYDPPGNYIGERPY